MSYKASVSNIYELLNEDGGATPQVNIGGQDTAPTKKITPALAKTQAKPKQETPKAGERSSQPKAPRQDRSIDRRPPKEFSSPKAGEEDATGKERRVNRDSGDRREQRGGGRGSYVPRGNKRPFDRRSGTGRGKEDKKGGAGKGNWGTVDDEQKAVEEGTKPEEKSEGQEPQGEQPQVTEAQTEQKEEQREPEEEDKTRTLDEFFKAKSAVKIELPKARQPGEGVSDAQWKGFTPLKKKEDEAQTAPKEEKKKESKKEVVPVNEVFKIQEESPNRQRRDKFSNSQRGGRGGKRGGGSGRSAPNVQDESAFPSLSTKA